MADHGHASTITFGTSGFSAELVSVDSLSWERASVETTHMGTTGGKTHIPAALYDVSAEITVEYDPPDSPPISGAAETISISLGGAPVIAFQGFLVSFSTGGQSEERIQASVSIKGTGTITGL